MEGEGHYLSKLQEMTDWNKSAIFTDNKDVLIDNSCVLTTEEIEYDFNNRFFIHAYDNRETTVGEGFSITGTHFDVHRFHPPLIYGRRGGPEEGEGIALCRIKPNVKKGTEVYQYLLITYLLPILSAKAVPQMVKFAEKHSKSVTRTGTHQKASGGQYESAMNHHIPGLHNAPVVHAPVVGYTGGQSAGVKKFNTGNKKPVGPPRVAQAAEGEEEIKAELVSHRLGAEIAQARATKEWTQTQLAKAINEKAGVVIAFENGTAIYNNNTVVKMEKAFGCHLERGRRKNKKKK